MVGNAGLGCGREDSSFDEEDGEVVRFGIGDGVGCDGRVDIARGVGSGLDD